MKASKLLLLMLILGFGGTVETAWRVRNHIAGPWSWDFGGGRFRGPSFSFDTTDVQPVDPGTALEVENRHGAVRIQQGAPGEVRVALRKVVFRPTEAEAREFASKIELRKVLGGGALRLTTNRPELEHNSDGRGVGFETHLELTVPSGTAVKVQNEHGPIEVTDVAEARVWGGHDSVRVERVAGAASLDTRHGDVVASDIGGTLTLSARHGSVEVRQVKGKATLVVEHGDVSATQVGGLNLTHQHGELTADGIQGDLEVRGQHAEVRAANVTGRVDVETNHRNVSVEKVGGDARIRARHGDIQATDVKGALEAESSYDDVTVTRAGGPIDVKVTHGGAQISELENGGRIRASGEGVEVDGFRGRLEVEADRGDVRLSSVTPLTEPLKVTATHGGIELEVPDGSRFNLDASSRRGEVTTDASGLAVSQVDSSHVQATMGGGGNPVVLLSERGNVRVRSSMGASKSTKDE